VSAAGEKFLPVPSPETAFWWENCRDGRLLIQRCGACGAAQFYPRALCSSCLAETLEWVQTSGIAQVVTFTICRVPVAEAYAPDLPYVVALVRLDEGPTMMTNIVECDPEAVSTGMTVEVVFEALSEQISLPMFRPLREAPGR
jgi:uncharacterized OB-fold protein